MRRTLRLTFSFSSFLQQASSVGYVRLWFLSRKDKFLLRNDTEFLSKDGLKSQ